MFNSGEVENIEERTQDILTVKKENIDTLINIEDKQENILINILENRKNHKRKKPQDINIY